MKVSLKGKITLIIIYAVLIAVTVAENIVSGDKIDDIIFPFAVFAIGTVIQSIMYHSRVGVVSVGVTGTVKTLIAFWVEFVFDIRNMQACAIRGDYLRLCLMIGFLVLCVLIYMIEIFLLVLAVKRHKTGNQPL